MAKYGVHLLSAEEVVVKWDGGSISIPIKEWDEMTHQVDMTLHRDETPSQYKEIFDKHAPPQAAEALDSIVKLTCGEHKLQEPCQKCSDEVSPELRGR